VQVGFYKHRRSVHQRSAQSATNSSHRRGQNATGRTCPKKKTREQI
jgi:hypothetical protein